MKRLIALFILLVACLAGAAPAVAHEGEGTLVVEAAEPAGPNALRYVIFLTYTADGHPAPEATVTAVVIGPDGQPTIAQPFAPTAETGRYEAVVRFPAPGQSTVRFTSVTPAVTLERVEQIEPPATSATAATTTTTADASSTTVISGGAAEPAENAAAAEASGDDGSSQLPIVLGVIVLAVLAAGSWAIVRRRAGASR